MATKKRIVKQTNEVVSHVYCAQEETIARMSQILVGNGHPEDGLAYKLLAMAQSIEDIKSQVDSLHTKYDNAITASGMAQHALDLYKKEMEGIGIGKKIVEENGKKNWDKWAQIFTLAIAVLAVLVSVFIGLDGNKKTRIIEEKINNLETPVVTRDGKIMQLPSDAKIKYFPSDFTGDSLKKEENGNIRK